MNSYILSLIEFLYGIILISISISLYTTFPEDRKRIIFTIIIGIVSFYYFVFASIQIIQDKNIAIKLYQIALISLLLGSSIGLKYLSSFLTGTLFKNYDKFTDISIIISFFLSIMLLIIPQKAILIKHIDFYWINQISYSFSAFILLIYFILLFIGLLIYFIILIRYKQIKVFKSYFFYSIIYILPFIYFINFKNSYLSILIQNFFILIWVFLNYFLLINSQKELVDYYKFQSSVIEGLTSYQFLLNKNFYIIDTTIKTANKLGFSKADLLSMEIKDILLNIDKKTINENLVNNEKFSGIYKIRKKNNEEIIVEIIIYPISNKKNKIEGYILICNDIEIKQNFEFQTKKESFAKMKFAALLDYLIGFIEQIDDGIAFLDEKGRYITANKSFLNYYKNIKDKILTIDDFINSKEITTKKIVEYFHNNKISFYEYQLHYIPKEKDLPLGYITLIEDCTEELTIQKELESSFKILNELISNFPLWVLIIDEKGKIIYFSKNLQNYFPEIIKNSYIDLSILTNDLRIEQGLKLLKKEGYSEILNLDIDLSKLFHSSNTKKLLCNLRIFNLNYDINVFCVLLENLENFEYYQNKIFLLKHEIDNIINEKTLFLSSIAYELRKYLINIFEVIYLFENYYKQKDTQIYFEKIKTNTNNLISQIDSIILYEYIENNKIELNFQIVEFNSYIESTLKKYWKKAKAENIIFKYLILVQKPIIHKSIFDFNISQRKFYILLDINLFKIIIENLISNSMKFAEKGMVEFIVYLTALGEENFELKITIKDNGVGIEKDKLKYIFDRFYQTENLLIKKFSGLGLGLYLVKRLVAYLGGDVEIDSEINKGTIVNLTLPVMSGYLKNIEYKKINKERKTKEVKIILMCKEKNVIKIIKQILGFKFTLFDVVTNFAELKESMKINLVNIIILSLNDISCEAMLKMKNFKDESINHMFNIKILGLYSFPFYDEMVKKYISIIDSIIIRPITKRNLMKKINEILI